MLVVVADGTEAGFIRHRGVDDANRVYVHGFGPDDFVQSGEGATFLQGVLGPVRIQEKGICISARCRAYVG